MKIAISGPMCWKINFGKYICGLNDDYKIYDGLGQKIKDIARELFDMGDIKDRGDLLINIANSMKEINQNVWINYIKECKDVENCIIDDLRFNNELNVLVNFDDWHFIVSSEFPKKERIKRIKKLYPENYEGHIKNMDDIEKGLINLPWGKTLYINWGDGEENIKESIMDLLS